jgi:hypothetical protein
MTIRIGGPRSVTQEKKMERKATHTGQGEAAEWREFLDTIQAGYRHLEFLQRELDALDDQAEADPIATALRKEFAQTLAEVLTREAFLDHCRQEGGAVPVRPRKPGTV